MNFKRLTSQKYQDVMSHRLDSISAPYSKIVSLLGEPHKNSEDDFPDDDRKVDVCWGIKSSTGELILVWNYKNGPVYGSAKSLEEIDNFSVWYSDPKFFEDLKQSLKEI